MSEFSFGMGDRIPRSDEDADAVPATAADDGLPSGGKGDVGSAPVVAVQLRGKFASEVAVPAQGFDRLKQTNEALNDVRRSNEAALAEARQAEALRLREKFLKDAAASVSSLSGKGYRVMPSGFSDASNTGYDTTPSARRFGAGGFGGGKAVHVQTLLSRPVLIGLGDALLEGMDRNDTALQLKMLQYVAKNLAGAMRPHQEAAITREHKAEMAAYVDSLLFRGKEVAVCPICLYFDVIGELMVSSVSEHQSLLPVPRSVAGGDEDDGLGDMAAPSAKRRRGAPGDVSAVYLGATRYTVEVPTEAEAAASLRRLTERFMTQMSGLTRVDWDSAAHIFNSSLLTAMLQEQTGVWAMLQERHPEGRAGFVINGDIVSVHLVEHMRWPRAQLAQLASQIESDLKDYARWGRKLVNGTTGEEMLDTKLTNAIDRCRARLQAVYKELRELPRKIALQDCLTMELPEEVAEVVEAAPEPTSLQKKKRRRPAGGV